MRDLEFICQNCNTKLVRANDETSGFTPLILILRRIPPEPLELECPNCGELIILSPKDAIRSKDVFGIFVIEENIN